MKGFIIISIIFIVMVIGIFINQYYVKSIYEGLIDRVSNMTTELSEENKICLKSLNSYWRKNVPFLKISIPSRAINSLSNEIIALDAAYCAKDETHVTIHLELLKKAIQEMLDCELSLLYKK